MELNTGFMVRTFILALRGIPVTVGLSAATLLIAFPLAYWIAMAKIHNVRIIAQVSAAYVSFARGTPIVLQILIVYSLLPSLINAIVKKAGWGFDVFNLNSLWYALAVFSFNTTALLSEVFRSALLTVDKGQLEAALAGGLSHGQAYRRIVIPQALVVAIPNICNTTINLIKGTSLAFLMTVKDVTAIAKIKASYGYNYIEAYLDIFFIYIIICMTTQFIFRIIERKLGIYRTALTAF